MRTFVSEMLNAFVTFRKLAYTATALLLSFQLSFAGEVDQVTAQKAAQQFLSQKKSTSLKSDALVSTVLVKKALLNSSPAYYIFNASGSEGFVIVSGENSINPILGYSLTGTFNDSEKHPEALDTLLNWYKLQINSLRQNNTQPGESIKNNWDKLLNSTNLTTSKSVQVEVLPLLSTTWDQGCGYNSLCPSDAAGPCSKTWAGCVAVCMGQVMKFWSYPASGTGSYSYTHYKYGNQSANFGAATYNWVSMPNNSGNTEISKLLYHLAVSVNMDFGTSGSGAYFSNVQPALVNYFGYSNNAVLTNKWGYTDENWISLLKDELNDGRPLMCAGGTHAFVIDGYTTNNYFHLNWGWSGSYDGYYLVSNLNPAGYNFTSNLTAMVGFVPKTMDTNLDTTGMKVLNCGAIITDSTTNGKNRINRYKNNYLQFTGKEKYYSLTTTSAGKLNVSLSNVKGKNLRLIALSYPNRDSVLKIGDTTLYIYPAKARKYYIVVDGLYNENGSYNIMASCPDTRSDLTVTTAKVSPSMIETGQSNVNFEVWVKNFGNTASTLTKGRIYYSDDNSFGNTDVKLDSISIPALSAGDSVKISTSLNMPAFSEGLHCLFVVIDPENTVNESDENDNTYRLYFTGLPLGIMDCSSSFPLINKGWHKGNTTTEGASNISSYGELRGFSGKEVIHNLLSTYKGVAVVSFSKKSNVYVSCIVLSACNENRVITTVYGDGTKDTVVNISVPVESNSMYYFVVDGQQGSTGEYWLKVAMPDSCPKPQITAYGDTTFCIGKTGPYMAASSGFTNYQWYKNGFAVVNEVSSYTYPAESGLYQVEVKENTCASKSNGINITVNGTLKPEISMVSGDSLKASLVAESYEWYANSVKKSFVTQTIKPDLTASYTVLTIDKGCKSTLSDGYSYTLSALNYALESQLIIIQYPIEGRYRLKSKGDAILTGLVEVYSNQGILLQSNNNLTLDSYELNLEGLPAGIYFVKIVSGNQMYTGRLLRQ